jgi:O-antigen/teichoic acid export membrane protein
VTSAARREESVAANGARWITVAMVMVGLLNYGYALLLTHLLSVTAYSTFAAGQGLILWASTVVIVSVPWVLAQALVRARSDAERNSAIRFAKLAGVGSGIVAAAAAGAIATRFAGSATALVIAFSIFVIFLGTTTTGWLQGRERMSSLSALIVVENLLKNGAGVLLVTVAGLGGAGALGAYGIGALVLLARWPRTPRGTGRTWRAALASRDLWRRAVRIAGAQGVVSLFVAIDVVLVALLPGDRALTASYQASAALARVPYYVAGAVALSFFPSLSRRSTGGVIAARAVRMYAAIALPIAVILSTVPAPILATMLPTQYGAVATLLRYTAVTGLAVGGISLVTTFFQAADDYSCLWWLGAGLIGYTGALLTGWRVDGIRGLAVGGALGAAAALALAVYRLVRRHGLAVLAQVPLAEPVVAAAVLIVLRPYPLLWLAVASLVGLHAVVRFVRPGARHARPPRWAVPGSQGTDEEPAVPVLIDAVWRRTARKATDTELHQALILARRNHVEGRLARAYPAQLPDVLGEARLTAKLFARNLHQVASSLDRAGIPAVLIEAGPPGDHVGTSIDMVILEQYWRGALTALADWYVQSSTYQLEHSATALLFPSTGPGLHLHADVSWFGVPAFPTRRLLARARKNRGGFLIPAPADYLRIWLAQALFQNLTLDLSRLLAVCNLLHPTVITIARAEASREGWRADFDRALAAAGRAIDSLDRGLPVNLPVPMPVSQSLGISTEHPHHGRPIGLPGPADQDAALQEPFAVAQRQRMVTG